MGLLKNVSRIDQRIVHWSEMVEVQLRKHLLLGFIVIVKMWVEINEIRLLLLTLLKCMNINFTDAINH